MTKDEIDQSLSARESHRNTSVTQALTAIKGKGIRLYNDTVKALYGEGPYKLSPTYHKFSISYDGWKEKSREERKDYVTKFFKALPQAGRESVNPVTAAKLQRVNLDPTAMEDNGDVTEMNWVRLSIEPEESMIPADVVRLETLKEEFAKAERLLNEPGAIREAASNDERMRTVKSKDGKIPLLVSTQTKNKVFFECQCKVSS